MIPLHLRTRRYWTVADFALFAGVTYDVAKARLQTYNTQLGGLLLIPSKGKNRKYTFLPALLARAIRDGRLLEAVGLFEPVDSLEMRVDGHEDQIGDLHTSLRMLASQTGANTREISKLRRRQSAA